MAFDSAGLLSQLVQTLGLPETRSAPTDAQLFVLLSNAQQRMIQLFATHVPHTQYGPPELLQSTDGGYTYTFAFYPLAVELREGRDGAVLYPSPEWGSDGFVMEGQTIRFPGGRSRTFGDGPYARYVRMPETIDATTQPILQPPHARQAIIYDAAREWATQGGNQNPDPYKDLLQTFLFGDPNTPGHVGVIPSLKSQFSLSGARVVADSRWWVGNGWT